MKTFFSNNKYMAATALLCAGFGIGQSIVYKDFTWFARSGSLIVLTGVLLLARTFIVGKDLLPFIKSSDTPYNVNSRQHFEALNQPVPDYVKNDLDSRTAVGWLGPLICFAGTVIWGYGDLLNLLIKK